MFFNNPMYFFAFAAASLVLFLVLKRFGMGDAARWMSLSVAVVMWWVVAGGPVGMWNQAYDAGTGLVDTIRSLAPFAETENIVPNPSESGTPDESLVEVDAS